MHRWLDSRCRHFCSDGCSNVKPHNGALGIAERQPHAHAEREADDGGLGRCWGYRAHGINDRTCSRLPFASAVHRKR